MDPVITTPAAPTAPAPIIPAPGSLPPLTEAQAAKCVEVARQDLAAKKITQAQFDQQADELNMTPEQRAPDTRTDAQKQIDQQFPPGKAEDFALRMYPPGQEPSVIPQEVRDFETNSRGWLVDAGFPRNLGNTLISTIEKVARTTKAMTPDQLETYRQTELQKMQGIYGDKLDQRLQAADDMIDQLEQTRPGLKNLLGSIGIGKSAMVWNLLIQQAERYHARKK